MQGWLVIVLYGIREERVITAAAAVASLKPLTLLLSSVAPSPICVMRVSTSLNSRVSLTTTASVPSTAVDFLRTTLEGEESWVRVLDIMVSWEDWRADFEPKRFRRASRQSRHSVFIPSCGKGGSGGKGGISVELL